MIGLSLESSIIFDDERAANRILGLFSSNKNISYAAVYLPNGSLFAEYKKDPTRNSPLFLFNKKHELSKEYLDVVDDIKDGYQVIGHIFIRASLGKLKNQQAYYRKILMYVLSFSIFLAFLLSTFFQKIITQPLNQMVQFVDELIKSENYQQRLKLNSNDELGSLAKGFNQMLNTVQEREEELTDQSANLQNIVDERTRQLYQKAHYDSLTNLPNRYLLLDRLEHAISNAKRKKERLAVLFMDLDRFKIINDSLGHDVGDQLLKSFAERLLNVGRGSDTFARLGGDEFVCLLESIDKPEDSGRVAKAINDLCSEPFQLENHVLHVTTSIGICVYPEDGEDSKILLKHADVSMYYSKEKGPGNYSFYTQDMNERFDERLEIENQLRGAIARDELYMVYQPQVCLKTNEIIQVEALLRWKSEVLGNVSPAEFIPIAEEIGLINQIGRWVINEVCQQQKRWNNMPLSVAFNISSSHLLDIELLSYVEEIVHNNGANFELLEFEITEEVFLEHSERTIEVLKRLQALGIKISIDDFGTGYSSLRYLKNLPVDTLKLDGMFVMDLQNNASSRGIVSSTIILAHSLNMKIVAECVENQEQLEFLRAQQCDYVQGFFLYKPLSANEIEAIFTKQMAC